jgi:type II secretory pathway pseudopilin PulG
MESQTVRDRVLARLAQRWVFAAALIGAVIVLVGLLTAVTVFAVRDHSAREQLEKAQNNAAYDGLDMAYDAVGAYVRGHDGKLPNGFEDVRNALQAAHPSLNVLPRRDPDAGQYSVCSAASRELKVTTRSESGTLFTLTVGPDGSSYWVFPRACAQS